MVSTDVPPVPIVDGAKDLAAVGAAITVRPLDVTALVTRAVPEMFAAVLLYGPPTMFEVTSTVITHEAMAALIVAPVTVIDGGAATVETTPVPDEHVVVMFGAAATETLAGRLSVKLMPLCAGLPVPLASVNVSVDVPPCAIVDGENALLSEACVNVTVWLLTPFTSAPPTVTCGAPFV